MHLLRSFSAGVVGLLLASGAWAQQAEPSAGKSQLSPASAAPQTHTEPDLRTDSKPRTAESGSTDSGPAPETLGMDATPLVDLGRDYSLPAGDGQVEPYIRLTTHHGVTQVERMQSVSCAGPRGGQSPGSAASYHPGPAAAAGKAHAAAARSSLGASAVVP